MGLKPGVLTDGLRVMQNHRLEAPGVLKWVGVAICTDEPGGTAGSKPSPVGLLVIDRSRPASRLISSPGWRPD
jgi:hypothetical protein